MGSAPQPADLEAGPAADDGSGAAPAGTQEGAALSEQAARFMSTLSHK